MIGWINEVTHKMPRKLAILVRAVYVLAWGIGVYIFGALIRWLSNLSGYVNADTAPFTVIMVYIAASIALLFFGIGIYFIGIGIYFIGIFVYAGILWVIYGDNR